MLSQPCEDDEEEEEGGTVAGGGADSTAAEDGDNSSSDTDDEAATVKSCPTSPANRRRVGLRKRGDADPRLQMASLKDIPQSFAVICLARELLKIISKIPRQV